MKKTKPISVKVDSDGAWKGIILEFFEPFVAFYVPDVHGLIDYSIAPEFLDKELSDIQRKFGEKKKRITDKLVKVRLKDGASRIILIHVEVQSTFEKDFPERMFVYFSMIYLRHREELVALAIYTNEETPTVFDHFEVKSFGTKLRYDFNTYKIKGQNEEALTESDNPFAFFVLAHLYMHRTKGEEKRLERLELKKRLYERIEEKIGLEKYRRLTIFVNEIMQLDVELESEFEGFIIKRETMRQKQSNWEERSTREVANQYYAMAYGETMKQREAREQALVDQLKREQEERELFVREEIQKALDVAHREYLERQALEHEERERERALALEQQGRLDAALALEQQERLERERALALELEARLEKERVLEGERREQVVELYFEAQWTSERIAKLMRMTVLEVEGILRMDFRFNV